MTQIQSDDIIRRAATAVIVACVVILAVTGVTAVPAVKTRLGWPASSPATGYAVGQQIDVPPAAYAGSERTLLYFSLNNCAACQRSKGTVAALAVELGKHPGRRMVMVTGTTFHQDETAFARSIGLDESRLVRVDLTKLRLKRVPALVLVDRRGRVLLAKEGAPPDFRDILSAAAAEVDASPAQ